MSRTNRGLRIADTDIYLPTDGKFVALWRVLRDQRKMCEARVLYEDVRLTSWRDGERLTVEGTASAWLDPDPTVIEAMVKVGLLDEDHRIPEHAWQSWFGPASARAEAHRAAARLGGLRARGGRSRADAEALLRQ